MTAIRSETVDADVLHIVEHQKFIPPFIALVNNHLDSRRHYFFFIRNGHKYQIQGLEKVTLNENASLLCKSWAFIKAANRAKKIVLHGLFSSWLIVMLFFQPWLMGKCYWMIWGGDLYNDGSGLIGWRWRLKEWFRRPIIRNLGHLVTYLEGDVDLARQLYAATGKWHMSLMYPSNLYSEVKTQDVKNDEINILIGNSADPSNQHHAAFDMLRPYADSNIKIYCPLSYGDMQYAQLVKHYGWEIFGEKFVPINNFMNHDQYALFLDTMDIAIFNHDRQQAMGNIISLLGMRKKVYIKKDISPYLLFKRLGVKVYDLNNFNLDETSGDDLDKNAALIRENFSLQFLVSSLRKTFE